MYNKKEWIPANAIKFVTMGYGKVNVNVTGNQYTWVNYNTEDKLYSKISGLYTYTYVPVLSSQTVGSDVWYKVPVSLTTNDNVYGYTLAKYSNYIKVELGKPIVEKHAPVISVNNKEIYEGDDFDPKKDVTAYDEEDKDLTSKIEVVTNKVDTKTPGEYEVTYKVVDSSNEVAAKTIKVKVKENKAPVINAKDKSIYKDEEFNEFKDVTATDEEDGTLTSKIKVKENTVKVKETGKYKVVYEVTDSRGKTTTKEIAVEVIEPKQDDKENDKPSEYK